MTSLDRPSIPIMGWTFLSRSALERELASDPEHNRGFRAGGKRRDDLHVRAQLEASGDYPVVEELSAILVLHVQHAEDVLEVAAKSRVEEADSEVVLRPGRGRTGDPEGARPPDRVGVPVRDAEIAERAPLLPRVLQVLLEGVLEGLGHGPGVIFSLDRPRLAGNEKLREAREAGGVPRREKAAELLKPPLVREGNSCLEGDPVGEEALQAGAQAAVVRIIEPEAPGQLLPYLGVDGADRGDRSRSYRDDRSEERDVHELVEPLTAVIGVRS